ncbi:hypothetical protein JCM15765_04870 [Paradesulfitobacterium aromaticivorans]
MSFSTFGRHVVADAWGVNFELLNNAEFLQKYMVEVAATCCIKILSVQAYKFHPREPPLLCC